MVSTPTGGNLITIVVPVYNRAATVGRLLESIDSQTLPPAAVILVDNGSTDSSLSILNHWAQSRPYAAVAVERRRGACCARNCGLAMVKTPWVMFVDSDDILLPSHVSDYARAIASHPDADLFGRDVLTLMPDGSRVRNYFSAHAPLFSHIFRATCATARIVYRTSLGRQAGGWNESLRGWDDWELGVRLLLQNPKVVDIGGEPTYHAVFTEESLTGLSFSARPGDWETALLTAREAVIAAGRDDLLKWIDARSMILAARYAAEGSQSLADCLREQVLSRTPYPVRMRIIYRHNLIFGRLTWPLARILFPISI